LNTSEPCLLLCCCCCCIVYAEARHKHLAQDIILGKMEVDGGNFVIESDCMWAKVVQNEDDDMQVFEKVYVHESDMNDVMPILYDEFVKWAKECESISAFPIMLKAVVSAGQKYGPAFVPRKSNNAPRKELYHEIAIAHGYYKREQLPDALVEAVRSAWPSFAEEDYM
jgi:hypothetical protein